ncbi:WecB/TagA/CpsF family glycosyltransferase [Thalassolituus sp. LLYu03]|uniref:WecB/TagA/CpsF family glycosyltransferase n=1 Tax=Thalassolituus sp. LLYu03 TaxID=3421656 RepID=UPI003D2B2657
MATNVTNISAAASCVEQLAKSESGAYVCVSNVHMCMETFDDVAFRAVVNNADLVIPDGKPISCAQKLLGAKDAEQVRGQDIMNELCRISGEKGLNIGLYGGSSESVLDDVVDALKRQFPDIQITYRYSPPFRPLTAEEDGEIVRNINDAQVNVLFVGIGCPKQERWMAEHKHSLSCVMLGVGAAFDFVAGSKKHAPRWMQKVGLEWLFRLASEPRRLWKRYLKQNPRFIYYFLQQWLLKKEFK